MLLVAQDTRLRPGVDYITPAINRSEYWLWKSGIIPDGPGAWAKNAPPPDIDIVKRNPMFCAAVPNLILRKARKRIPSKGDPRFDGGIAAYFSGVYGPGYYSDYDEPFDMHKAKEWAQNTRSGVLIGKGYRGPAPGQQGHVGILLPSGFVLQSNGGDGLNWYYRIEDCRSWFDVMVHPKNWIEYEGDTADWAK